MANFTTNPYIQYNGSLYNVGPNSVTITYGCSVSLGDGESNAKYIWEFYVSNKAEQGATNEVYQTRSTASGTIELAVSTERINAIWAKMKVEYTKKTTNSLGITTTTTEYLHGDADYSNRISYGNIIEGELSYVSPYWMVAYPRNTATTSNFWQNKNNSSAIQSGKYIDEHITIGNINQWLEQLGIWASWKKQSDYYASKSGNYVSLTVPNMKEGSGNITLSTPTRGDDITATWYNNCSKACNGYYLVSGCLSNPDTATTISADHFIDLAEKVTTWT